MDKEKVKRFIRDAWHFIWESDSVWSWIANIIIAFVLIKFVVYPVIGMVLTTSHPIVAVVSGSMEHDGSFEEWWNTEAICNTGCTQAEYYSQYNISEQDFKDFSYSNGFNIGDIMLLKGSDPENIQIGDIIVFRSIRPDPIIHRVIDRWKQGEDYYFKTKGDHNPHSYPSLDEDSIHEDRVVGKAVVRVPFLGYIKIIFVKVIANPYCRITNNLFPCR